MDFVHFTSQRITQSKTGGKTAVVAAAYRNGEDYVDVKGKEVKYSNKKVDSHLLMTPEYLDHRFTEQELWLEADKAELNKKGQLKEVSSSAREYEFSLPKELTPAQNQALACEFAKIWVEKHGIIANLAFHKLNENNPHCHMLTTVRRVDEAGNLCEKVRELDNLNSIKEARNIFVDVLNKHLTMAGFEGGLSAESYKDQGKDIEPVARINNDKIKMNERLGVKYEDMPEVIANRQIIAERKKNEPSINEYIEEIKEPEPEIYFNVYKKTIPENMTMRESIAQDFALLHHRNYLEAEFKKNQAEKDALIKYRQQIEDAKKATVIKKTWGLFKSEVPKYSKEQIANHIETYKTRLEAFKAKEKGLSRAINLSGLGVLKTHLDEFEKHTEEMRKYIKAQDFNNAYKSLVSQSVEQDNPYRQVINNQIDTSISSEQALRNGSTGSGWSGGDSFGM